jgi:hypothetical protein
MASFMLFVLMLSWTLAKEDGAYYGMLLASFCAGLFWIGSTSFFRHAFILLRRYLGSEVSPIEFLSTQFVCVFFPFLYVRVRREADRHRAAEEKTH